MKIQLVEETNKDVLGLYVDPESELSKYLNYIQDGIEAEDLRVERKVKYSSGKLCKYFIELVDNPDTETLNKRKRLVEGIEMKLDKVKWEYRDNSYIFHVGKINQKELYIVVAKFGGELSELEVSVVENVREKITQMFTKPKTETPKVKYQQPIYQPPPPPPPQTLSQTLPPKHPQRVFTQKQISIPQHQVNVQYHQPPVIKQNFVNNFNDLPKKEVKEGWYFKIKE